MSEAATAAAPGDPVKAGGGGPALDLSAGQRAAMIAAGFVPLANALVTAGLAFAPAIVHWQPWTGWLGAVAWLLLVPPLVVRATLAMRPLPPAEIAAGSPAFLGWWFTAQWQVIFNRLPWIEETIRLVPGLYSWWLRLWGARIGRFVYWTPGLRILDRSLLAVGHRVAFGAGVKINPHVIMPGRDRRLVLYAGTVSIGDDALVGGYSLLLAGSWIGAGEASPGKRELAPFTGWAGGRRVHLPSDGLRAADHEER
jgi:hypothetical protein